MDLLAAAIGHWKEQVRDAPLGPAERAQRDQLIRLLLATDPGGQPLADVVAAGRGPVEARAGYTDRQLTDLAHAADTNARLRNVLSGYTPLPATARRTLLGQHLTRNNPNLPATLLAETTVEDLADAGVDDLVAYLAGCDPNGLRYHGLHWARDAVALPVQLRAELLTAAYTAYHARPYRRHEKRDLPRVMELADVAALRAVIVAHSPDPSTLTALFDLATEPDELARIVARLDGIYGGVGSWPPKVLLRLVNHPACVGDRAAFAAHCDRVARLVNRRSATSTAIAVAAGHEALGPHAEALASGSGVWPDTLAVLTARLLTDAGRLDDQAATTLVLLARDWDGSYDDLAAVAASFVAEPDAIAS